MTTFENFMNKVLKYGDESFHAKALNISKKDAALMMDSGDIVSAYEEKFSTFSSKKIEKMIEKMSGGI
jgi:hypothetical protein